MMDGNPNNWMNNMHQYAYVLGSSIPFNNPLTDQILPPPPPTSSSWSQLLFSGVPGEEERLGFDHFLNKKLETSWDEQILNNESSFCRSSIVPHHHHPHDSVEGMVKQEVSQSGKFYGHGGSEEFLVQATCSSSSSWSSHMAVSSSPRSCVTSLCTHNNKNNNNDNSILDFTYNKAADHRKIIQPPADHTSECNSTAGGVSKKARVQSSSSQPPLKVRKEKLGDRITALHQLVSPFGKTDTASVLLEAIGYIRFLQAQIEALSSPYLGNSSRNTRNHQSVHVERTSVFPEDPGQLLNDTGLKRSNTAPNKDGGEDKVKKELRSRGLCLVPLSFTQHFGSENGADFWSPPYASGF